MSHIIKSSFPLFFMLIHRNIYLTSIDTQHKRRRILPNINHVIINFNDNVDNMCCILNLKDYNIFNAIFNIKFFAPIKKD